MTSSQAHIIDHELDALPQARPFGAATSAPRLVHTEKRGPAFAPQAQLSLIAQQVELLLKQAAKVGGLPMINGPDMTWEAERLVERVAKTHGLPGKTRESLVREGAVENALYKQALVMREAYGPGQPSVHDVAFGWVCPICRWAKGHNEDCTMEPMTAALGANGESW